MPFISSQTYRKSKREILFDSWGYSGSVGMGSMGSGNPSIYELWVPELINFVKKVSKK